MAQIDIDSQDVATAANFLEQYLSDAIVDGDFTRGTALRDLTVGALASIFAFLRKENTQVKQLQSLKTIAAATDGDDEALRNAASAILSNLFITPKAGARSRGYVICHSSEKVDIFIPTTSRFTKVSGLDYVVDSTELFFIPKTELVPTIEADGRVTSYEFRVPLVAVRVGPAYDIAPGTFLTFDRFNSFVTKVEAPEPFFGGKGVETVAEILARAPTAVSVRNLINERSIAAVLNDTFPEIKQVYVAGMGDPEMQRDRVLGVAPNLSIHVGGMVDIYLLLEPVETTFTGTVGALFARPDGLCTVFRDASTSFAAVQPGNILRITGGIPTTPTEFLIVEKLGTDLIVSERSAFPVVTDEASPPTHVTYSIGTIGPAYANVIGVTTTGTTSRNVRTPGRITLPGGPVLDILDVAIINPQASEASFKSGLDGFVHFPNYGNDVPSQAQTPINGLQFMTKVHNPLYAQSSLQWMEVVVGTDSVPSRFDGYQLRVRYKTLVSFGAIDNFIRSRRERTSAAHQIAKGHHLVLVSSDITYKLRSTATTALNDASIAQAVISFINRFDTSVAPIDASAISELIRSTYPSIASVSPITLLYVLRAPTGELLTYETADEVTIAADKQVAGPTLGLLAYGVSDRTARYLANTGTIRVQQVI